MKFFSQTRVYQRRNIRTVVQFFYLIMEHHATGLFSLANRHKHKEFLNYSKTQKLVHKSAESCNHVNPQDAPTSAQNISQVI
jgi:hypothetical protein